MEKNSQWTALKGRTPSPSLSTPDALRTVYYLVTYSAGRKPSSPRQVGCPRSPSPTWLPGILLQPERKGDSGVYRDLPRNRPSETGPSQFPRGPRPQHLPRHPCLSGLVPEWNKGSRRAFRIKLKPPSLGFPPSAGSSVVKHLGTGAHSPPLRPTIN